MMRIKCAAIRYDGKIYEGRSHCEIGTKMVWDEVCPRPYPGGKNQGFVTECGIYVERVAAMSIAIEAGQVEKGKTIRPRELFSEDLNCKWNNMIENCQFRNGVGLCTTLEDCPHSKEERAKGSK